MLFSHRTGSTCFETPMSLRDWPRSFLFFFYLVTRRLVVHGLWHEMSSGKPQLTGWLTLSRPTRARRPVGPGRLERQPSSNEVPGMGYSTSQYGPHSLACATYRARSANFLFFSWPFALVSRPSSRRPSAGLLFVSPPQLAVPCTLCAGVTGPYP
jgi:hypothetical protein